MKSTIHKQQRNNLANVGKTSIVILGLALGAITNGNATSFTPVSVTAKTIAYEGTPLCMAIMKGDTETVKKFVEYGADVNQLSNGMTPLMVAARYNKVDIIRLLLSNGARIDTKDERGFTAMKYAELSKASDAIAALKNS